jgi:hypothetical protein
MSALLIAMPRRPGQTGAIDLTIVTSARRGSRPSEADHDSPVKFDQGSRSRRAGIWV